MDAGTIKALTIMGCCLVGGFIVSEIVDYTEKKAKINKIQTQVEASISKVFTYQNPQDFFDFVGKKDLNMYNNLKNTHGSCIVTKPPKCEMYRASSGCPFKRDRVKCDTTLRCSKARKIDGRGDCLA